MKYQIFTITFNDVTAGAEVASVPVRRNGKVVSQPAITVGMVPQNGDRRVDGVLGVLPVEMPLADVTSKPRIFYASVKRGANVSLVPEAYATSFDFAIIKVVPFYGRGWGIDYEGVDRFEKLTIGVVSDGATYPAWNEQYIALVPRDITFRATRLGETVYGRRAVDYTFVGDQIVITPV